ncbi:MAG: hypothetical protein ABJC19_11840 [Gemmatimonadota bacterium]
MPCHTVRRCCSLLAIILALPAALPAQRDTLAVGRWHGEITPTDDDSYAVSWIVTRTRKGPQMELRIPDGPSTVMGGVKLKGGKLSFLWAAGGPRPFFCTLYRDGDGSYSGKCDDPVIGPTGQYVSAEVTMWPPGTVSPRGPSRPFQ